MIIKEIDGNIIDEFRKGNIDVLVHGCNCFHIMGAGLAGQIKWTFPKAFEVDTKTKCGDYEKLGTYTVKRVAIKRNIPQFIINAYTQYKPGANFEYLAFITFLKTLNKTYKKSGYIIGFPEIGCGIGGADWSYVVDCIEKYTPDLKIVIVHYNNGLETVGTTKDNIFKQQENGNRIKTVGQKKIDL